MTDNDIQISVIVTLLGNYVKRFITIIERTVLGAVARVVEQLCRILLRLGQVRNSYQYWTIVVVWVNC